MCQNNAIEGTMKNQKMSYSLQAVLILTFLLNGLLLVFI